MRAGRIIQVVTGAVLAVAGAGVLLAAVVLAWFHVVERDSDGWYSTRPEAFVSTGAARAIVSGDVDLGGDPGPFGGSLATVRLRADREVFLGIAPAVDVARYLDGVAHDVVVDGAYEPGALDLRPVAGTRPVRPPALEPFWVATGTGALTWDVEPGEWTVVVMRPDGGTGVVADVAADVRIGWLPWLAGGLALVGVAVLATGVWAVTAGVRARDDRPAGPYPVRVAARLDEPLSRWRWLVKWFLAIPHLIVLALLWSALAVTSVLAFFAILVTGRYPRPLFDFAVGVLRWTWRVGYYAFSAIGTDRYPPFSLAPDASYPADLDVVYPHRLSRALVLVKSWLLALPQLLVVGVLAGGIGVHASGVIGVLVLAAGFVLLVSGSYPVALFDVVVGCNRWSYRVAAYVLLLTDEYPPFRFDAGGAEPSAPPSGPAPVPPPTEWERDRELTGAGR